MHTSCGIVDRSCNFPRSQLPHLLVYGCENSNQHLLDAYYMLSTRYCHVPQYTDWEAEAQRDEMANARPHSQQGQG